MADEVLTARRRDSYQVNSPIKRFSWKYLQICTFPARPVGFYGCIIASTIGSPKLPTDLQGHGQPALSEAEKSAVREQLRRLLDNPFFSHSKRFPTFLQFVTEQTLAGEADNIKERTLGIEIFGRDAEYDTASDPIVRVTAAEIRKRVAQYYQEAAHEHELRITLPSGSYIPQFHWPKSANDHVLNEVDRAAGEDMAAAEAHAAHHPDVAGTRCWSRSAGSWWESFPQARYFCGKGCIEPLQISSGSLYSPKTIPCCFAWQIKRSRPVSLYGTRRIPRDRSSSSP